MFDKLFKKEKKLAKSVSIFISAEKQQLIIAPQYLDNRGLYIEQKQCFTYPFPINSRQLGNELTNALNMFHYEDKMAEITKKSDWPAYQVSKSKTIKAFEKEYIYISIHSENNSNLILTIEGLPYPGSLLNVNSTISYHADANELGKRVLLVHEACKNKSFD